MWTDWANDVLFGKYVPDLVTSGLDYLQVQDWLKSLIVDGIVAGIGTVLGFLPQIFVLFICLGVLEDIGYESYCLLLWTVFSVVLVFLGNFIPMLISTGCGVPAVMSSRTIEMKGPSHYHYDGNLHALFGQVGNYRLLIAGAFFPSNL